MCCDAAAGGGGGQIAILATTVGLVWNDLWSQKRHAPLMVRAANPSSVKATCSASRSGRAEQPFETRGGLK